MAGPKAAGLKTDGIAELERVLAEIIAPLIWADRGEIFVVELSSERVALHLGGRFTACPGTKLVAAEVLEPVLRALVRHAEIEITSGAIVPEGAVRLEPPAAPSAANVPEG